MLLSLVGVSFMITSYPGSLSPVVILRQGKENNCNACVLHRVGSKGMACRLEGNELIVQEPGHTRGPVYIRQNDPVPKRLFSGHIVVAEKEGTRRTLGANGELGLLSQQFSSLAPRPRRVRAVGLHCGAPADTLVLLRSICDFLEGKLKLAAPECKCVVILDRRRPGFAT